MKHRFTKTSKKKKDFGKRWGKESLIKNLSDGSVWFYSGTERFCDRPAISRIFPIHVWPRQYLASQSLPGVPPGRLLGPAPSSSWFLRRSHFLCVNSTHYFTESFDLFSGKARFLPVQSSYWSGEEFLRPAPLFLRPHWGPRARVWSPVVPF